MDEKADKQAGRQTDIVYRKYLSSTTYSNVTKEGRSWVGGCETPRTALSSGEGNLDLIPRLAKKVVDAIWKVNVFLFGTLVKDKDKTVF